MNPASAPITLIEIEESPCEIPLEIPVNPLEVLTKNSSAKLLEENAGKIEEDNREKSAEIEKIDNDSEKFLFFAFFTIFTKKRKNAELLTIVKLPGSLATLGHSAKKTVKPEAKTGHSIKKNRTRRGLKSTKCNVCRKGKELISCRKCPKSFHVACLQLKEENLPKMFLCVKCK